MSRALLEKDGYLTPVLFALTPNGMQIVGLAFNSYETKRAAYQFIGKKLRQELNAYGAVLINECWFLDELTEEEKRRVKTTNTMETMPRDHPKRKEGVSVLLATYGWNEYHLHPFRREDKRIIWEPEKKPEPGTTVTNEIFPAFDEGVH
jgi:hypothetical protein